MSLCWIWVLPKYNRVWLWLFYMYMHRPTIKARGDKHGKENCKMGLEYHLLALEEASRMVMDKIIYE